MTPNTTELENDAKATARLTIVATPDLLANVQEHRRSLARQFGLKVSASQAAAALIRAGLAAQQAASA